MKKIYRLILTFCVAGTAVLANAAAPKTGEEISVPLKAEKTLKQADVKEMTAPVGSLNATKTINTDALVAKGIRKAAARKAAPESIVGKTFVASYNDSEDDFNCYLTIAAGDEDGEIVLEGFAGGYDLKGTYDAQTGLITIPTGVVLGQFSIYGNVILYSLDDAGYIYTDIPITATVSEDKISFETGIYAAVSAGYLALMFDVEAFEANANLAYSTETKQVSMPVYVKKTDETTVKILGFSPAVLSAPFNINFDEAVTYNNEYTLDSNTSTLAGVFEPFSNYGSYGDFYFGMISGGYIDDPVFSVNVADNKTTIKLNGQGFMGYSNQGRYSGAFMDDFVITADFDIYALEVEEEIPEWEDAGTATLIDGWVLPAFGVNQLDEDYWFEVPLQRHVDNENLYRLVDPYHAEGFAAKDLNESTKVGYIVFDATDPDHVLVNPEGVEAGFASSQLGLTKFYCYNSLVMYSKYLEVEPSDIIEVFGDEIAYTTFKDGVLSLGYYDDPEYGRQYDANFGYQGDPTGGYSWTDENNDQVDMTAFVLVNGAKLPSESEPLKFEGNMTAQVDMSMGSGEPDLVEDLEEWTVTASFNEETNELTIYNFADLDQIIFTVDLSDGSAVAKDQIAEVEDYGEDGVFTYYYYDVKTRETTLNANVSTTEDGKTLITVAPWGEGMDAPEFGGLFFMVAYYNTVITLDGVIPGLEVAAPSLSIDVESNISYDVEHKSDYKDYAEVTFYVTVVASGLDDDADVKLYYSGPLHEGKFEEATKEVTTYSAESGHNFTFKLSGLDRKNDQEVSLYAVAGPYTSETVTKVFHAATTTGVEGIEAENGEVRYFNLQGVKVNNPDKGVFVKVTGNKVEKVVK